MSAAVLVLSFMSGATGNIALRAQSETLVWNFTIYPPGSPQFNAGQYILPPTSNPCVVGPCPNTWSVTLLLTPVTVYNDGPHDAIVTTTVYSDNSYVYQQRVTVPPRHYVPIAPGSLSLGYILNSEPTVGMPVKVSFTTTHPLMLLRDTAQPTDFQPGAAKVWGAMVELKAME